MDSSRHERRASCRGIPEYRIPLVHGVSPNLSAKSKSCSNDKTASGASNSWAVKKVNLMLAATKGLGCAASISFVEEAITVRPVDPEAKRMHSERKTRVRKFDQEKGRTRRRTRNQTEASPAVARVCCGPGILFSPDAACVDCVQSRRRRRRRAAVTNRQREEVMIHYSPLFVESHADDLLQEWRLDIEGMSYEELLDLSDRIGHECMGLKKNELLRCLSKAKSRMEEMLPLLLHVEEEWNCSICQDGLDFWNEVGRLNCGHSYHIRCLKRWLQRKNSCPICKDAAIVHQ